MGIKVTEMTEATQVNNSDWLMIVQNGENKKITKENLQDSIVDAELEERVDTLEDEVEALQEENAYLNNLVEQAFDKKEVEGEELSINDTINAKMEVGLEGNTKQETTTGKNKFDVNNNLISNSVATSGVTTTINDDGTISTSGTTNRTYINMKYQFELVAGTYIVNGCPNEGSQNGYSSLVEYTQGGTSKSAFDTGSGATFTIDTDQTITFYPIRIGSTANINMNSLIFKPMIRLSSISDSSYEPYTNGASPNPSYPSNVNVVTGDNTIVVSNKNLWKFNSSYTSTGYATILNQQPIKLLQGNYILSFSNVVVTSSILFRFYNKDKSRYYDARVAPNAQTPILNAEEDIYYVTLIFNEADSLSDIQLEKGTTATSFVEHQEQTYQVNLGTIELCKIGDYKDYFYKSNDKWYKHSEIGKVVLDGTQTIGNINTTSSNTTRVTYLSIINGLSSILLVCNRLQRLNMFNSDDEGIYYNATNGNLFFRINKTKIGTTENEINTYLQNNNIIIYYPLATPTDTEITDTTLISQLEALKSAMSYAEQTNISQINDDTPFILKVTALASYNSRIVALEQAILNANRSTQTEQLRKSNEIIEEPKEEVVEDKDESKEEPKEER